MLSFIKYPLFIFFAFILILSNVSSAKEEIITKYGQFDLYSQDELRNFTEIINNSSLKEEEKSAQIETIDNIKKLNSQLRDIERDYEKLNSTLANKDSILKTAQEALSTAQKDYAIVDKDFSNESSDNLQNKLAELNLRLQTLQGTQSKAQSTFLSVQTLPSRAPNIILANNQAVATMSSSLESSKLSKLQRDELMLNIYILEKKNDFLQSELVSQALLEDIANYELKTVSLEIDYISNYIEQIKQYNNEVLMSSIESTGNEESSLEQNSLLADEIKINSTLEKYLQQRRQENLKLTSEKKKVEDGLSAVKQIQSNLNSQLDALTGSIVLSRLLNRQQSEIPNITISYKLDELIPDINIWIFDLRRFRDSIFDVKQHVDSMIAKNPGLEQYRNELELLIAQRRDLYDQLYSGLSTSLSLAIDLKSKYEEYTQIRKSVATVINDQLFWIASNPGLSVDFFMTYFPLLKMQLSGFASNLKTPSYWTNTINTLITVLLPVIFIGGLVKFFNAKLVNLDNRLAMRLDKKGDRFWVTPLAFVNKFVLALPKVSFIVAIGATLIYIALDNSAHQITVTLMLALHVAIFIFYLDILKPNSIAQRHFSYSPAKLKSIRFTVDKIYWAVIPILIVANIREIDPVQINDDIVGYSIILVFVIFLNYVTFNYVKEKMAVSEFSVIGLLVNLIYIAVPLTLFIMLALGYYYTAVKLINRIAFTFYICLVYVFISNIIRRELYVAEIKLVEGTRQKHSMSSDNSLNKNKTNALDTVRMELINSKAFKLINIVLLCITAFFLYLQWYDLAGVLSYLDTITLYASSTMVDGKEVISSTITLADIVTAAFIILVAVVLNRNLPALLERLFLLKQNVMYKSTSYTVRIISSYIITALGIIFAAGAIGISWDNLQWLVAALSVGLGFGLQEIFANFVSGLIILFERQIRVGDIITLNGLSGTVKKIRIRAITFTDFENKELVVPNKSFITSALTNWSLSNTITKLEFLVGVAYDADISKAKRILTDIVRHCENLSTEHDFNIFVKSLDASCVTISCEVFVKEIGLRKPTYDYLSTRTLKLFAKEGIEIPFNQLDVTIRNQDTGKELKLETIRS